MLFSIIIGESISFMCMVVPCNPLQVIGQIVWLDVFPCCYTRGHIHNLSSCDLLSSLNNFILFLYFNDRSWFFVCIFTLNCEISFLFIIIPYSIKRKKKKVCQVRYKGLKLGHSLKKQKNYTTK